MLLVDLGFGIGGLGNLGIRNLRKRILGDLGISGFKNFGLLGLGYFEMRNWAEEGIGGLGDGGMGE